MLRTRPNATVVGDACSQSARYCCGMHTCSRSCLGEDAPPTTMLWMTADHGIAACKHEKCYSSGEVLTSQKQNSNASRPLIADGHEVPTANEQVDTDALFLQLPAKTSLHASLNLVTHDRETMRTWESLKSHASPAASISISRSLALLSSQVCQAWALQQCPTFFLDCMLAVATLRTALSLLAFVNQDS